MDAPRASRIVSFYSYKGGTGRSMMLANVAWVLASSGRRVLVIDWDLEAPGLHRYLHPFLVDPELRSTEGLIDLVTEYATRAVTPGEAAPADDRAWYHDLADLTRYAFSIDYGHFPPGATLDVVPAGRQGPAYASRANSFDWPTFYDRLGGGAFLEVLRQRMRSTYDYVLIDSRTGVSDTSGICTVQMPDVLVVCFTLNRQSIEGAAAVAESVIAQRPDIRVLPVPSRVELGEKERLDTAREYAYGRFAALLGGTMTVSQRDDYWARSEVLYQPFYAYEEVLAPFADRPRQPAYLLASVERLTGEITDGEITVSVPPPEQVRTDVMAQYLRRSPVAPAGESAETRLLRAELAEREAEALRATAALAHQQTATARATTDLAVATQRSRRLLVGAAAVVAVLVAVVVAFLVTREDPDTDSGDSASDVAATTAIGGAQAAILVTPADLDVGSVAVGDSGQSQLTVTNQMSTALTISVELVDEGVSAFRVLRDGCAGAQFEPGAGCVVAVGFEPETPGTHTGSLLALADGTVYREILLTGFGVDAVASPTSAP